MHTCVAFGLPEVFLFINLDWMPLLKKQKQDLAQSYLSLMNKASNVVVVQHSWLSVNDINEMRQSLEEVWWSLKIVKKRVFLKWIEWEFSWLTLDQIPGSVALLVAHSEENKFAPLKVVANSIKSWRKEKKTCEVSYVWWRMSGAWVDERHVSELADLPSKDELVAKFLYLLNHPVTSFARVLQAVADKD